MSRALVVATLALAACAEPPFSPHLPDNVVLDIARARDIASASAAPARPATAWLVTADKHVVAWDLAAGSARWSVEAADLSSRIATGREVIAYRGTDAVVVRARVDGSERCRLPLGGARLVGVAADDRVYVTLAESAGNAVLAIDAATCAVLWRDAAPGSVGAPAARGGVLAVPYRHQAVVLLDGATGLELARVRSTDDDVLFVRSTPEGLVYGSNGGVYLLDEKSASGTRAGSAHASARLGSQAIKTFYAWDAYQPSQVGYTAFDRNRLLWRVEKTASGIGFVNGLAYLHNFRFLFGFEASTGAVRWAYAHPRIDLVGSDDTGGAIVFAAVDGELGALDARTGARAWQQQSGLKLTGVTFDADGWAPPAAGEARPVDETLAAIIADPDSRFTAVKVFSVDALARKPGPAVTATLLAILLKPGVAPSVSARAATALVARKDRASLDSFHAALARHADFLVDEQPRAIDVLARVVAALDDRTAAPLLGAQLLDFAVPLPALKDLARALVTIGGKESIAPLRDFLLAYRCDPAFAADPTALVVAAEGLLKVGGAAELRLVKFVAEEPRSLPALAQPLRAHLAAPSTAMAR